MTATEKFNQKLIEKWHVVETPCFPCSFKVEGINWPAGHGSNSTCNFFETYAEANTEANRRNKKEGW